MKANFVIDDRLWAEFKARAKKEGKSASEVLVRFIQDYVDGQIPPDNREEIHEIIRFQIEAQLAKYKLPKIEDGEESL